MKVAIKILTALAAVAGAVYVIATYGDQIVAWAKKILGCTCCEGECECAEGECCCEEGEECCCECAAEEPVAEEAAVEEVADSAAAAVEEAVAE